MLDGLVEVGVVQHDEGVAAAEFHRRFLQVLSGPCGHHGTGGFAAGQRHGADAHVVNHLRHLVFGDEQVGVRASGCAGFQHQPLPSQRALRHAGGMLDHDHVAGHQVGRGKAGDLVIRVVPRLDAKQHADGAAFDHRFTARRGDFLGGQKGLGVLGVIVQDGGAQGDFAQALWQQLAHFQRDQLGKLLRAFAQDGASAGQHGSALGKAFAAPFVFKAVGRLAEFFFQRSVVDFVKFLQDFSVVGIGALVGHDFLF